MCRGWLLVRLVRTESRSGGGGHGPGWGRRLGAAEELSPGWGFRSVCWRRTTVSGEEKPLHTLGSPLRKGEKKAGVWGVDSLLVQFPGVCPPSRHEGKPQPPLIGAAPLSLSLSPCPPFASCLLWFQSRLQNTKLLLTFILQAFHHS
ncbi:hypothetical protein mRhiFer1_008296 [Rhinolophus ferrumequinum]|uniref:Uncharacterized protein n=1 Tax=Rhinolophus ferrumequinum TaxID=59479 RepID=A0A7J7VQV3_RHIFE|nr:hypothetical protein mRhiFer1_008296 [Rhinolophus ferrumequinum]